MGGSTDPLGSDSVQKKCSFSFVVPRDFSFVAPLGLDSGQKKVFIQCCGSSRISQGSEQRGSFDCMATFAYMSEFGDTEPVYIEAFDGQLRCYRARLCFSRAIVSYAHTHTSRICTHE